MKKKPKIKLGTLITDGLSSEKYHSIAGTYSSSQLKTVLEDPDLFYQKYIAKTEPKLEMAAFDIGTYFHTAILEPHLLKKECAVFPGIRRGAKWESFKKAHEGKAIITDKELGQAETLIKAVKQSEVATKLLKGGTPEVSAFVRLLIAEGRVYHPTSGRALMDTGWKAVGSIPKEGTEIIVKVRADLLAQDNSYIVDLKSCSGNTKSEWMIAGKVSDMSYDLSAALYLDIFSLVLDRTLENFIWIFASKDVGNCQSYLASPTNITIGRIKYRTALVKIAEGIQTNWKFKERLEILEPSYFERKWLSEPPVKQEVKLWK